MWALLRPYAGIIHDSRIYVGRALADLSPHTIGLEYAFLHDGQSRFSLFPKAFAQLVSALGPGPAAQLLSGLGLVLWFVGALAASASVVAAAMAVWPRLSKGPGPGAITYWGQVRGLASPQAVAEALAERGLLPPERTYQQLLVLSAVVQRKYRTIRWSMVLAGVGIALVVAAFFFAA